MQERKGVPPGPPHDDTIAKALPFASAYEGAKILTLRQQRWGGVRIQVKDQRFSKPFEVDLKSEYARFSVVLDLAGSQPEARSSRARPTVFGGGTIHQMNFTPAHCSVWACSNKTSYFRAFSMYFRHEEISKIYQDDINPINLFVPRLMFFDQSIFHIARLLEIEIETTHTVDELYIESLTLALLLRLSDVERIISRPRARGGLAAHQLRQVTEYLCEHLVEGASLQELANIAGLSRSYFSRAFRESTGMPVHQWLLQKRILRSKEFLLSTDFSIAQIALAVGFADQAHFSRMFGRAVGTSPAIWRRARTQ